MAGSEIVHIGTDMTVEEAAELLALTQRLRTRLQRTAEDLIAVGSDLIRAKELVGHGGFGPWLDAQFSLSRRSAEQFMAAARRFEGRSEAVSHLPSGVVLELSALTVSDELVERVLGGELPASVAAIRREKSTGGSDQRAWTAAQGFLEQLERFSGTSDDYAAGIAAHVLRGWPDLEARAWFGLCMSTVAEMLADNLDTEISRLELARTTVRRLREQRE